MVLFGTNVFQTLIVFLSQLLAILLITAGRFWATHRSKTFDDQLFE